MKRIKDFIYDTNDILIAILVLFFAALIIMWRMDVILNYPKVMLGTEGMDDDSSAILAELDDDGAVQLPSDVADSSASGSGDSASTQVVEVTSGLSSSMASWNEDGTLKSDITVDIQGASATAAVGCLVDKGIFTSYDDYVAVCASAGLNPEKVSAGTFTFSKGMTKAQIAKKVNWS